jgi:hypothetical protein
MKKPRTYHKFASPGEAKIMGVSQGTRLTLMKHTDFLRIWKLAKEAMHTNAATAVPESAEDREMLE